jgi:hypothetical protein
MGFTALDAASIAASATWATQNNTSILACLLSPMLWNPLLGSSHEGERLSSTSPRHTAIAALLLSLAAQAEVGRAP